MSRLFKTLFLVSAAAAAGYGLYKLYENYIDGEGFISFDQLVKEQYVVETLDGKTLSEWFKEESKTFNEPVIFFIAKPTAETAKMFGITGIPDDVDKEHSLLQVIVDKEEMLPKKMRLISFSDAVDGIWELFGEEDYVILEDNK